MLGASGRRAVVLPAFSLGLLVGAMAVGLAAATLSAVLLAPLPTPSAVLLSVMGLVALPLSLRDLGVIKFWMPENKRLVPEQVFRLGSFFGPLQFGIEMGTGMRTYVTSSLPYILLIDAFLSSSLANALLASFGFAAGRSLMTVLSVLGGEATVWDAQFKSLRMWRSIAVVTFLGLLALMLLWS